ncbi:cytochrome-c peroxidase [Thalassotalea euphylliae]|uniref:Cytochrome-c peroxidase n=1 Tax=Thalassotalea euphylliae TaxID=1655234 RepID=A0A3E0TP82_9GAMM|nr:cytochrome c peroxidase [Thalassotalea euphylliae]REL26359.1 cytochrome-c peroxidase [Thalassotalea euphylliae]
MQRSTLALAISITTVLLPMLKGCEQHAYWSAQERSVLQSLQLKNLPDKLHSPSNRYANNPQAAAFGKQLFFDPRMSQNGELSCASCHQPERAFTDGLAKGKGLDKLNRNSQSLLGLGYSTWFYWDGRKDSLWAQALVPFEAAKEMGSSRIKVLRVIGSDSYYHRSYENLFGRFPKQVFNDNILEKSGPWGDTEARANWQTISKEDQQEINRAFVNIGKALAAYERSLSIPRTKSDHYLTALFNLGAARANSLLSDDELAGIRLFINTEKTHCFRCHNGPLLTNNDFHHIGSQNNHKNEQDYGRFLGLRTVVRDPFNCLGQYSDASPEQCSSLRYLNKTAPYFHDGRFNSLEQVMQHYLSTKPAQSELPELNLTEIEQRQVISFMNTLNID